MPLPLPRLDNRTFDELFDEGRLTLPRLAPGWTDHNYHDPGITLIDLFAWLVEMDMYRLDRTSAAAYRAFLRLVGIEPRPPQVAETVLTLELKPNADPLLLLESHYPQVAGASGAVAFQLAHDLTVLPVQLAAVLGGSAESPFDYSRQNRPNDRRFPPFGPDPQQGDALYLGFDAPLKTMQSTTQVSLYVWVDSPEKDLALRQRLIDECTAERALLKHCQPPIARRDWQRHYSARVQWEYYDRSKEWKPLSGVVDETRGLTLSGAVCFLAPEENQHIAGSLSSHPKAYFIRCQLVSGYYECPPEVQCVAINAVPARHAIDKDVKETQVDVSGRAGQQFHLKDRPVIPGSIILTVNENGKPDEWSEALTWDHAGPQDRVFVLSPERDEILFDDGRRGRVPKAGATIEVTHCQVGGGAAGNVPAGTLTRYMGEGKVTVRQPFAAAGGAEAESLDDAKGRAVAWLGETRRAVTLKDFEDLAQRAPGAPVARAHAIADYDPALPCVPALGNITVVVVSPCARLVPEPGPDLLRAVERYLERRRTLTSQVHVVSPSFITVAVHAHLHTSTESDSKTLIGQAHKQLEAFFHPLTGGQDGKGWPIGRDVYRSEILALLNSVPGVTHVDEVSLQIEAELETYAGFVRFNRIIRSGDVALQVQARLFVEPAVVPHRLVERAGAALEDYIRSQHGWLKHRKPEGQLSDVTLVLRGLPGVVHMEEVTLSEESPEGLCENVPVCPTSLIIPGSHQIRVSGSLPKGSTRAPKPPC